MPPLCRLQIEILWQCAVEEVRLHDYSDPSWTQNLAASVYVRLVKPEFQREQLESRYT